MSEELFDFAAHVRAEAGVKRRSGVWPGRQQKNMYFVI